MNQEDIEHIRELVAVNRMRLQKLEVQAAALGSYCPAPILVEIDETRDNIERFEKIINQNSLHNYIESRKVMRDFGYDLDSLEYKLNKVIVQETKVYRFLEFPFSQYQRWFQESFYW